MKKVFKFLGILIILLVIAVAGIAVYVKKALPDVGAAPDIKVEINPATIERGRYLANHVMACMDCHSTRNWNEFSGPIVEGTLGKGGDRFDQSIGLPGVFYSRNITPAGLKDWTDGEIFRAITSGVDRNGGPLFPIMPHPSYGRTDENDVKAVIAYLRSIPAISNEVPAPEVDFPMNFILHTIPQKPALTKKPDTTDMVAYGKYMITAAACGDCHTPAEKGAPIPNMDFAGGRVFEMPMGTLRSSNISPDETGIKNWSKAAFIARFKQYADSASMHQPVQPTDFNTIMPWTMYAGMTETDLGAIYEYLRTVTPVSNKVEKFTARAGK